MLASVWRRKWLIVAATLAGAGAGVVMAQRASPVYEAQTTLWIEKQGPANQALEQDPSSDPVAIHIDDQ